jgi:DNA modification methylase
MKEKRRPGEVRDAIITVLSRFPNGSPVSEIQQGVNEILGKTNPSSIRSYLRLNTPSTFKKSKRGYYALRDIAPSPYSVDYIEQKAAAPLFEIGDSKLINDDCFHWMKTQENCSIHAVVTDPPYGLLEYTDEQQAKLRSGKGGVWRIPPSFDGSKRSPLPRFTTLTNNDLRTLDNFFYEWGKCLLPILVPGANVVVASNPLVSYIVSGSLVRSGLERRGEIIRLVMTMRGGDRPKDAHKEFSSVSVMPRSMWEPWLLFRKPLEGRTQDNLRKWKTGGFRRPAAEKPFGDVIVSSPTHKKEKSLAPHPSLKPQSFMRVIVRGVLPLGEGIILDPFAGSGSTLAAAEVVGYQSIGIEKDARYFKLAKRSISKLIAYQNGEIH